MDERDCKILIALTRAPFDSMEAIGRAIGVSGTAVKARLDRLAAERIYRGFAVGPSARALGKHARLAVWAQGPIADAAVDALLHVDEVAWAARAYPTSLVCMLYRDDPAAPLPGALARIVGRAPDTIVTPNDPRELDARGPLSPLDWRVIDALMDDPRASVRDLAARTGLSARTVRDRRDALFAAADLMAYPVIDATIEEGVILYSAYVAAARAEDLKGVRMQNATRIVTHHDPPGTFLTGYVRTYAEAHVVEEKLRESPGVVHVAFNVPQGTLVAKERMRSWVRGQISKWNKARRSAKAL